MREGRGFVAAVDVIVLILSRLHMENAYDIAIFSLAATKTVVLSPFPA